MIFRRKKPRTGAFKEARLISQAMALEEHTPPRFVSYGVGLIVLLIFVAVAGAAVFPVITSADAAGIVKPTGSVVPVQHVEGGAVVDVLVRDGDFVEKGQTMLRLSAGEAQKRFDQVDAEYWSYIAEAERLKALAGNRRPSFQNLPESRGELAVAQMEIYRQSIDLRAQRLVGLDEKQKQAQSQIALLDARLNGARAQARLLSEEYEIYRGLLDKGYTTKIKFYEVRRELAETRSRILEVIAERTSAEAVLDEAVSSIREFESEERQTALNRLGELTGLIEQTLESRTRLAQSVERTEIVAPVSGFVNNLKHKSLGAAVQPGDSIAEIVPYENGMVVEAKVTPRDVGFLKEGQPARVVIEGFDVLRFKPLRGELTHVSASSFVEQDGVYYFLIDIALNAADESDASIAQTRRVLRPGMSVQANIITGERSLLEYLMRPLYDSFSHVFSER